MQCHGYVALLGSDDQSWGWNLVENHLLHNGDAQGGYPLLNNAPKYQVNLMWIICLELLYLLVFSTKVGERIRVILDCDDNTLSFEKNYEFLGVAFRGKPNCSFLYLWRFIKYIYLCLGLPDKKLYPTVSAVYGNTEVSMVYLGPPLDG